LVAKNPAELKFSGLKKSDVAQKAVFEGLLQPRTLNRVEETV
jgi:hypothetical protein